MGGESIRHPPEQIIGTISETKFGFVNGEPVLTRLPKIDFVDDGPGKPVGSQFPLSLTLIIAVLLLAIGFLDIVSMVFDVGPFG